MKYKVINSFSDLQDNCHKYTAGKDFYPREGLEVTKERIAELSGSENKQGKPLIEPVEEKDGEEKDGIDNMKVDDLKAYAGEKGINLDGLTKKADILAKIKEAEATEK